MRDTANPPWFGKGPGAAPFLQGYWHRAENLGDTPPSWHPTHLTREWIDEWRRGWNDRDQWRPPVT